MALSWHYLGVNCCYGTSGQPGSPGAHSGIGLAAVADWWLGTVRGADFDTEAAATPTKTIDSAKMRIASFILVTPF